MNNTVFKYGTCGRVDVNSSIVDGGLMTFDTEREAWKWADSHLSGDRYPRNQREVYPASRFIVKRPTSM